MCNLSHDSTESISLLNNCTKAVLHQINQRISKLHLTAGHQIQLDHAEKSSEQNKQADLLQQYYNKSDLLNPLSLFQVKQEYAHSSTHHGNQR